MGIGGFLWRVVALAFLVGLVVGIYLGYHLGGVVGSPAVAMISTVIGHV